MSRKIYGRIGKNKADLTDAVYKRHGGLTKNEAADAVDALFTAVKTTLIDGRPVRIRNFGVFEVTERQDRIGVNPINGRKMNIPAHRGLNFRPARNLRNSVVDDEPTDKVTQGPCGGLQTKS